MGGAKSAVYDSLVVFCRTYRWSAADRYERLAFRLSSTPTRLLALSMTGDLANTNLVKRGQVIVINISVSSSSSSSREIMTHHRPSTADRSAPLLRLEPQRPRSRARRPRRSSASGTRARGRAPRPPGRDRSGTATDRHASGPGRSRHDRPGPSPTRGGASTRLAAVRRRPVIEGPESEEEGEEKGRSGVTRAEMRAVMTAPVPRRPDRQSGPPQPTINLPTFRGRNAEPTVRETIALLPSLAVINVGWLAVQQTDTAIDATLTSLRRLTTRRYPHLLLSAGARRYRSISAADTGATQQNRRSPAGCRCCRYMGQTDGRTDTRPLRAASVICRPIVFNLLSILAIIIRYDMIRDAILTCALKLRNQKLKKWKKEELKL